MKVANRMRHWPAMRAGALLVALGFASTLLVHSAKADGLSEPSLSAIRGGAFESVLPPAPAVKQVHVADFRLDRTPVTNEEFARFVRRNPEWRRDRIARLFADEDYLSHWRSATEPGQAIRRQPIVRVSWFAASAYCEARGARLPTWHEWEYAAVASETAPDARNDAAWRQRILTWYSQSARATLPQCGQHTAQLLRHP